MYDCDQERKVSSRRLRADMAIQPQELERNIRTIYFGARHNVAITTIADMFNLQSANGISMGKWKRGRSTITSIIHHVAEAMDAEMRTEILNNRPLAAVTIDGWRSDFGIEHALVSLRLLIKGKLQVRFLRCVFA